MEQFFEEVEDYIPARYIVAVEKNTHGKFLGNRLTATFEDKAGHRIVCFPGTGIDKLCICYFRETVVTKVAIEIGYEIVHLLFLRLFHFYGGI